MATQHGKVTYISVAATDISTFTQNSEFTRSVDTHEDTAYGGDGHKTYHPGLIGQTFTLEGKYDTVASGGPSDTINAAIDGDAAVTVIRRIQGTGSGKPELSFSAIFTSFVETSPVGGIVTWSAECQVTGAGTTSTQA